MPEYLCMFCPFKAGSIDELLAHEDLAHGEMVDALEGVDGNEEDEGEPITGEETEEIDETS